ncbi:MAG: SPOR domain-containing protein [Rhodanobacteraceae bacterium]
MFVRLLFLLLVALNVGAAAWLLFGPAHVAPLPPATDPGVPELKLWADAPHPVPRPPASAASAVAATPPRPDPDTCTTVGPFLTAADMRAAMQTLSPHVERIQYRQEQVSHSHGYWVYLPALATREAALDEAHQLAAKGIRDYYVVTAGDTQNTISLGVYNDQTHAGRRQAMVEKQGFPAKVQPRTDTAPAWWLDYAVPTAAEFDWRTWLTGRNDLQAKPIDCF